MPAGATARLNLRISEDALATIREAADAQQQDVTSFVLGAAMERARSVVLESRVTQLTEPDALRLEAALGRDARAVPQLAALIRDVKGQRA